VESRRRTVAELNELRSAPPSPADYTKRASAKTELAAVFERYGGSNCDMCAEGYIGYPYCVPVSTDEKDSNGARALR
jgi:hypothetical protein